MTLEDIYELIADVFGLRLFAVGDVDITLASLLWLLAGLLLSIIAGRLARAVLVSRFLVRTTISPASQYSLGRLAQYLVLAIGLYVTVQTVGVRLTGLTVVAGLLSVGIGFGLQTITSNFVSGLILMFERPIKVGDWVVVNEVEGEVREINIRATTVRGLDNTFVIVPNSQFITDKVFNWTSRDPRIRIAVELEVAQDTDLALVLRLLMGAAEAHPLVLRDPSPEVRHLGLGANAWRLELLVWLDRPGEHRRVRSDLYFTIVDLFRDHGIAPSSPSQSMVIPPPSNAVEGDSHARGAASRNDRRR